MQRLFQILFWSIISAAFIGPGTVTTAASSGARHGYSLLWALVFSTVACLVLQEASARVAVVSGKPLARAIRFRFRGGFGGVLVVALVSGAIIVGCAAYQAGNILGAVAGISLGFDLPRELVTVTIGMLAGLLLFFGTTAVVARMLGVVVALMGIAFLMTAVRAGAPAAELLRGAFVPSMPAGSSLLVLGLIGTTVVPYNLFLGSGIAAGQKTGDLRFGLSVAIVLGGLISMGVLVVGATVTGPFGFEALSEALSLRLGGWASSFFSLGLFAAGLSSAITAPMAAAITARGLFGPAAGGWGERSRTYRLVWMTVLASGVAFGLGGVRPVPAIILAQALNGVLLPFVTVFLFFVVNDRGLMGKDGSNGAVANILMGLVVFVTIMLGVTKTAQAVLRAFSYSGVEENTLLAASAVVALVTMIPIGYGVRRSRARVPSKPPGGDR
jgi:Mn2+/Fe2+ NRAMP family transporter